MEECYGVWAGNRVVGKVQLQRQGLYVRIVCRCQTPAEQIYRLFAVIDDRRENLGVVVPEGDGFVLDKKIPAKRLGTGRIQFCLSSGMIQKTEEYTPIYPEEPFRYMDRMKTAFLISRTNRHPEAG